MSAVLVQDLKEEALARLQTRAMSHGWSLQNELKAILDAAAATVDPQLLRGWGELFPAMEGAEEVSDSLAMLERSMAEVLPSDQAWVEAFLPPVEEDPEPDALTMLAACMPSDWDPRQPWVEHFLPAAS
jgi:hypothetical protein